MFPAGLVERTANTIIMIPGVLIQSLGRGAISNVSDIFHSLERATLPLSSTMLCTYLAVEAWMAKISVTLLLSKYPVRPWTHFTHAL